MRFFPVHPPHLAGITILAVVIGYFLHIEGFGQLTTLTVALGVWVALTSIAAVRHVDPPAFPVIPHSSRNGGRTEVSYIAWSFSSRDGRANSTTMRKLRSVAAERLRLHGIDPQDRSAVEWALGRRAASVLYRDAEHTATRREIDLCLDALERVDGTRAHPAPAWRAPNDHTQSYQSSPPPR